MSEICITLGPHRFLFCFNTNKTSPADIIDKWLESTTAPVLNTTLHFSLIPRIEQPQEHRLLMQHWNDICIFVLLDPDIQPKTCDIVEIYLIVFIGDFLTFDEMEK